MVDMETVKERALRGAFVGAGSFAASATGGLIEEYTPGGDMVTSAGQIALGLGISVGADEVFSSPESVPNEALEFVGYGIQGAGFSNLGTSFQTGAQTGRVVNVRNQSSNSPSATGANNNQSTSSNAAYSLDTA